MSAPPNLPSSRWLPIMLAVPFYVWISYALYRERWAPKISWRRQARTKEEEEERKRCAESAVAAARNSDVYRWAAFVTWVVVVGAAIAFTIFNTWNRK